MKIQNYKVSWRHFNHNDLRIPNKNHKLDMSYKKVAVPRYGQTNCYLTDINNPNHVIIGEAYCTPNDNYNKCLGRYISFKRAVEQISSKEKRQSLWNEMLQTNIIKK